MKQRKWNDIQLIEAVKTSDSIRKVLEKLGLKPAGGNYKQLNYYITELKLDTSHFLGKAYLRNKTHNWAPKLPISEILVLDSQYQSHKLKLRLIKEGIFEAKCFICELTTWLNKPISLELDHINGINTDNRLINLRLLCPNCHAQTSTYRGLNKKH